MAKEDAARKAVNGELLVSISGRVGADETVVDVYMRPDSSLYSTINGGAKIEEVPKVGVNESLFIETTHHESKAVYTGATVGGITTGGVHYTKPSYSEKVSRTDRGSIKIQIKNLDITVRLITFPESVRDKFKRDAVFCHYVKDLKIKCS